MKKQLINELKAQGIKCAYKGKTKTIYVSSMPESGTQEFAKYYHIMLVLTVSAVIINKKFSKAVRQDANRTGFHKK